MDVVSVTSPHGILKSHFEACWEVPGCRHLGSESSELLGYKKGKKAELRLNEATGYCSRLSLKAARPKTCATLGLN